MSSPDPRRHQRPSPPQQRFVIWGLVIGQRLPALIEVPHVKIEQLAGERLASLTRPRKALQHPVLPEGGCYYSGTPGDLIVRSRHVIWVWVDALDAEAALAEASARLMPPVVGALSALTCAPVIVEVLRVAIEDETGYLAKPHSPYSPSGFFGIRNPDDMLAGEVADLQRLIGSVQHDAVATALAKDLTDIWAMQLTSGASPANLQNVLLRFFFVIEQIARKEGHGKTQEADLHRMQEPVIDKIRRNLGKGATTSQMAKQIRNAALDLDRLATRFLPDQIRQAAARLALDAAVVDEALALNALRNARLGHAARDGFMTSDEMQAWIPKAERVALAFFRAYITRMSSTR